MWQVLQFNVTGRVRMGCSWQVEGEVGERRIREIVINHDLLDFAGQVKDLDFNLWANEIKL